MIKRAILKGLSPFNQKGFTLLELIVVFSIIAILSTLGVAQYVAYSKSQILQQADNDIVTALNTAKSKASSQIKPTGCSGGLQGYGVNVYETASGPHPANTYDLIALCTGSATPIVISSTKLPSVVTFDSTTDISNVFFAVLTGAVTGSGKIVLMETGLTNKLTTTVDSVGVIQ